MVLGESAKRCYSGYGVVRYKVVVACKSVILSELKPRCRGGGSFVCFVFEEKLRSRSLHALLYLATIYKDIFEPGVVARASNLSIRKAEAGELPRVERKLEMNSRPCQEEAENPEQGNRIHRLSTHRGASSAPALGKRGGGCRIC